MDDDERTALILYLAENPTAGDLIPGTGGLRKLRWGLEGRGKRGGDCRCFSSRRSPRTSAPIFHRQIGTVSRTHEVARGNIREAMIMNKAANSIRKGLEEALAYAKGRGAKKGYRVHLPEHVDVKAIRTKLA